MSVIFRRAKLNKENIEQRNREQEERAKDCIRAKYGDEWFVDDVVAELAGYRLPTSFSEIDAGDKIKILSKNNISGLLVEATTSQVLSSRMLRIKEDHFGKIVTQQRYFVFVQHKNDLILKLEELVKQFEDEQQITTN